MFQHFWCLLCQKFRSTSILQLQKVVKKWQCSRVFQFDIKQCYCKAIFSNRIFPIIVFPDRMMNDKKKERFMSLVTFLVPVPVAALSKAWVYGHSLAGVVGSNPSRAWMSVCCECCVLSGRGLCIGLITRPEESYRVWCV
jgi:hypothetical protein